MLLNLQQLDDSKMQKLTHFTYFIHKIQMLTYLKGQFHFHEYKIHDYLYCSVNLAKNTEEQQMLGKKEP